MKNILINTVAEYNPTRFLLAHNLEEFPIELEILQERNSKGQLWTELEIITHLVKRASKDNPAFDTKNAAIVLPASIISLTWLEKSQLKKYDMVDISEHDIAHLVTITDGGKMKTYSSMVFDASDPDEYSVAAELPSVWFEEIYGDMYKDGLNEIGTFLANWEAKKMRELGT